MSASVIRFVKPLNYSCFFMRIATEQGVSTSGAVMSSLRELRDGYLSQNRFGVRTIERYYETTTSLVERFEMRADKKSIAKSFWMDLEHAHALIQKGFCREAAACLNTALEEVQKDLAS
ncbi:MAG: hypothetical protein EOP06_00155 [Proteobacteria bacterium]|nr:MAG: hypothetical protein EOP06_00155 [Pseudomonadota bacterium]